MLFKVIFFIVGFYSFVFAQSDNGWNNLHKAVYSGDIENIKKELPLFDINSITKAGLTPLHMAIKTRNFEVIDFLLENGANIEAKDEKGFTPLYYAVVMNHIEITTHLLKKGANPNTQNELGNTPMHQVARKDRVDMYYLLVENGAKKDISNNFGMKPINFAIEFGSQRVIGLLMSND